jgi:hypothetical protein
MDSSLGQGMQGKPRPQAQSKILRKKQLSADESAKVTGGASKQSQSMQGTHGRVPNQPK